MPRWSEIRHDWIKFTPGYFVRRYINRISTKSLTTPPLLNKEVPCFVPIYVPAWIFSFDFYFQLYWLIWSTFLTWNGMEWKWNFRWIIEFSFLTSFDFHLTPLAFHTHTGIAYSFFQGIALLTMVNLTTILCPAPSDPFYGPYYRWCALIATVSFTLVSGKVYYAVVRCLLRVVKRLTHSLRDPSVDKES